jgi:hypothetical protein
MVLPARIAGRPVTPGLGSIPVPVGDPLPLKVFGRSSRGFTNPALPYQLLLDSAITDSTGNHGACSKVERYSELVDDCGWYRPLLAYDIDDLPPYHIFHAVHGLHQFEQPEQF